MDFGCFLLGSLGSAHFSHFLITEFIDGVLPCLFLFFLGQLYRMVDYYLAVGGYIAYLDFGFIPKVYSPTEDFIVGKTTASAFLYLSDDIGLMRSFS